MRRINADALLVLVGLAILLAFALGLVLGAKVESALHGQLADRHAAAVEVIE